MSKKLTRFLLFLLAALILVTGTACSSSSGTGPSPSAAETPDDGNREVDGKLVSPREEELQFATEFTLTHYEGGYKVFTVSSAPDKKYLIVPEGKRVPEGLEPNTVVLKQPLNIGTRGQVPCPLSVAGRAGETRDLSPCPDHPLFSRP